MKILCVDDEKLIIEMLVLFIEEKFDHQIIVKNSGNDAIECLKENNDIKLIICDYNMPDGNGGEVYKYIRANLPKIPFVLMTSDEIGQHSEFRTFYEDHAKNTYLPKPWNLEEVVSLIEKLLPAGETTDTIDLTSEALLAPKYIAVPIDLLENINICNTDIFIRISEEKMIKIFKHNEFITTERLVGYKNKGCEHLYIPQKYFEQFSTILTDNIFSSLDQLDVTPAERVEIESQATQHLHCLVHSNMSIDEKTIELVHNINTSVIKNIKNLKLLKDFLPNLTQENYIHQHSLLLSYVCCSIAHELNLDSKPTLKALSAAALLHDINITDEPLAIQHDSPVHKLSFFAKLGQFKNHPTDCSKMVKQMRNMTKDVSEIIYYHHEDPTGEGFPNGVDAYQIPPLACLFILGEVFVNQLWTNKFKLDFIPSLKKNLMRDYNVGNFQAPLVGLISVLNE